MKAGRFLGGILLVIGAISVIIFLIITEGLTSSPKVLVAGPATLYGWLSLYTVPRILYENRGIKGKA